MTIDTWVYMYRHILLSWSLFADFLESWGYRRPLLQRLDCLVDVFCISHDQPAAAYSFNGLVLSHIVLAVCFAFYTVRRPRGQRLLPHFCSKTQCELPFPANYTSSVITPRPAPLFPSSPSTPPAADPNKPNPLRKTAEAPHLSSATPSTET